MSSVALCMERSLGLEEGEGGVYPLSCPTGQCSMSYRTDRVEIVDRFQYNDSANDYFEREPYSVLVKSKQEGGGKWGSWGQRSFNWTILYAVTTRGSIAIADWSRRKQLEV